MDKKTFDKNMGKIKKKKKIKKTTEPETGEMTFWELKMQAKNTLKILPVCRHWKRGFCMLGSKCNFRHPTPTK